MLRLKLLALLLLAVGDGFGGVEVFVFGGLFVLCGVGLFIANRLHEGLHGLGEGGKLFRLNLAGDGVNGGLYGAGLILVFGDVDDLARVGVDLVEVDDGLRQIDFLLLHGGIAVLGPAEAAENAFHKRLQLFDGVFAGLGIGDNNVRASPPFLNQGDMVTPDVGHDEIVVHALKGSGLPERVVAVGAGKLPHGAVLDGADGLGVRDHQRSPDIGGLPAGVRADGAHAVLLLRRLGILDVVVE